MTLPKSKLEVHHADQGMTAVNDVVLHSANPTQAIRLGVTVDGQTVESEVVGDGIVAAGIARHFI